MTDLFLDILNSSYAACFLIGAVALARLLLKKAPKWISAALWALVALRLLSPALPESAFSMVPSVQVVTPDIVWQAEPSIHTGIPAVNSAINPIISQTFAPEEAYSANPLQIWLSVAAWVWAVGVALMAVYTAVTYWRLRVRVRTAVRYEDHIFQSERVDSPFVLGLVRPRIYLPFQLTEQDMPHVIAHEQAHIRRKDHWWKPLGFLLLSLHWFNPAMWLAYILLCRDIELACDEKVIRSLSREQRADYSQALMVCSANRKSIAACPLAFGEVGVKARIKSVLSYKKPAFWLLIAALVLVGVLVFFSSQTRQLSASQTSPEAVSLRM